MAILVLDEFTFGISPTPSGVAIQINEAKGLPDGLQLIVSFEDTAAIEAIHEATGEAMKRLGPQVAVADVADLHKEVKRHGGPIAE